MKIPQSKTSSNKRKVFLINPPFQLRFMAWILTTVLSNLIIFYVANLYFIWDLKKMGEQIGLATDHIYFRFIDSQHQKVTLIFMISACVVGLVSALLGLLLSHRIAGPIHRMKKYFDRLRAGESVGPLSFREDDFFKEIPDHINPYVTKKDSANP